MCREIIAVCSEIHIKHINTLCGQNAELLYVNPLNAELNSICHLLVLLGGATIVVVSRLRVKSGDLAEQKSLTRLHSPCSEGTVEAIQYMALKLRNKRSRDFKCCSRPACLVYDIGAAVGTSCVLQRDQHVRMNDEGKNKNQNKKVTEEVKR